MTVNGWLQIGLFSLLVLLLTKPVGLWLYRVFESRARPLPRLLGPVERLVFRACGVDPDREQDWKAYAVSLLVFSAMGLLVTYAILRLQAVLPLNPNGLGEVAPALAWNTAVSFTTNTNWQAYAGESTMGYLAQMAGLAWHNFTSAAAGIGVALALARGLTRRGGPGGPRTLGNFWADLVRATLYVLLPLSLLVAVFLVSQGVVQTLSPNVELQTVEGARQVVTLGPVASQEAIKMLGTNGGGFFNANSAHPFENPTPLVNLVQMLLIFLIPAGLTFTYGRMARDGRQGWALFAAMAALFLVGATVAYGAEAGGNPAFADLELDQSAGNLEGKEMRFGVASSALFATVTTDASCGAVNSMHDSFTPLGGLVHGEHAARRGRLRRGRRRPLRDAGHGHPDGVPRRPDGGAHARVPGEEGGGARDEAGRALRPGLPGRGAGPGGLGGGRAAGDLIAEQRRASRALRAALCLHQRRRQQRLGLRRPEREHDLLEPRPRRGHAGRAVLHDYPGARHRRRHGREEVGPRPVPAPSPPAARPSSSSSSR